MLASIAGALNGMHMKTAGERWALARALEQPFGAVEGLMVCAFFLCALLFPALGTEAK